MTIISRYNSIDVMKFIMSFAVITIHVPGLIPIFPYSPTLEWLIRLAVPFFFITSGYLITQRMQRINTKTEKKSYLISKAKKFARMYVFWLIIYFPLQFIVFSFNSPKAVLLDIINYIINIIFSGDSYLSWPLWYLYSSIWIYLIMSVLITTKHAVLWEILLMSFVIGIKLILPLLPLGHTSYFIIYGISSRILGGAPYIIAGSLYYYHSDKLSTYSLIFLLYVLSILLFTFNLNISPLFGGLATVALCMKIRLPENSIYSKLNALSIWIFLLHMYVLTAAFYLIRYFNISYNPYLLLILIFVITFIVADFIYILSTRNSYTKKLQLLIQ